MIIKIYWLGEKLGAISSTALPGLQQMCEQNGIQIDWEAKLSPAIPSDIRHLLGNRKKNLEEIDLSQPTPPATPTSATPRIDAEIYLDYTILLPQEEDTKCLVMGNLFMKNRGTEELLDPIISFQANSNNAFQLGGQILPPNMTETMGVIGSSGTKGWRYVEKDWKTTVKEKGEIQICPTHLLTISPNTTEVHSFQIYVEKGAEGKIVTIDAIVTFPQQRWQVKASNRISLSF